MNFATYSSSFISTNAAAYKAASKVFKAIEANDWANELAAAGVLPSDIPVFAVLYVAQSTGIKPKNGQRGYTFNGVNTAAHNRVKYLVSVATGQRAATKAKSNAIDQAARCVAAYNKLTAAEKRAFLRAIGK